MAGSRGGQCPSLADYVRGRRAIWEATPAACPGAVLAGRTLASVGEQLGNLEDLARVAHARDTPRLMAQLLATAAANRQSNGILLSARELESFDRAVASAPGRSGLCDVPVRVRDGRRITGRRRAEVVHGLFPRCRNRAASYRARA